MSSKRLSRRDLVPGLAAGATAALLTAPLLGEPAAAGEFTSSAAAGAGKHDAFTAGPCRVWKGHTLVYQFFLPAVQRPVMQSFNLTLRNIDGSIVLSHNFQLMPGTGVEFTLEAREDGALLFNGDVVPGVSLLVVIAIIAILIGLLLPAVQKVRASATSFVPNRQVGEQNVDYFVQFVEQG